MGGAKGKGNRKRKVSSRDADIAVAVMADELTAQQRGGSVNQVRRPVLLTVYGCTGEQAGCAGRAGAGLRPRHAAMSLDRHVYALTARTTSVVCGISSCSLLPCRRPDGTHTVTPGLAAGRRRRHLNLS